MSDQAKLARLDNALGEPVIEPGPQFGEWQDIATAPKDGTAVLVWLASPYHTVACWEAVSVFPAVFSPQGDDWSIYGLGWASVGQVKKTPTHWMPLPEPPK